MAGSRKHPLGVGKGGRHRLFNHDVLAILRCHHGQVRTGDVIGVDVNGINFHVLKQFVIGLEHLRTLELLLRLVAKFLVRIGGGEQLTGWRQVPGHHGRN